jgi:hypothetical protein
VGRAATGSVRTKALLPAFLLHNFEQLRRRPDPRPRPSANFEFVQNAAKFAIVILRRIELLASFPLCRGEGGNQGSAECGCVDAGQHTAV